MTLPYRNQGSFAKRKVLSLGILLLFNTISWIVVWDLNKTKGLEVNFFNVGQGDAIFIVSPKGQQILIDGGPDSIILKKLAQEMPFWDNTLDLIILTHPEKDHMAGLIEVFKRYKVENILWTGIVRDIPEYDEWIKLIAKEGAEIKIAKAGQQIKLSRFNLNNFIYFDIFYPFEELAGQEFKNSNDTSITTRLVFNDITLLFTGDISDKVEKELVLANLPLESDILKVSHHGSKYSSSDYFLENVLPEIAVIQVGENSYGHPTKEVLERLEKFDIKALRTDLNGDIKIISNGKDYAISNFQN